MITTEIIDVSAKHKDKTTKHNVITTEHTAETTEHCVKAPNNKNEQQKTVMAFHTRQ